MKNLTVRERYMALTALASRVLPSPAAINKVTVLLATRYQKPYDATELGRKQMIAALALPEGFQGDGLPLAIAEARQKALDDYMALGQPVRAVPDTLRLTAADMPKKLEREGGEANAEGIASIKIALGSLYVWSEDERKLIDALASDELGFEPEE